MKSSHLFRILRVKMKKRILTIIQLLISIGLLTLVILKYNISLFDNIRSLSNPNFLFISLGITIIFIPLSAAFRWKILLKYAGLNENIFTLIKVNFISIFWGIFLPSSDGFAAVRIYQIEKRHPQNPGKSGSTVVVEKLFGFLLLCFIGIIGTLIISDLQNIFRLRFILLSLTLLVLLVLIFAANNRIYNFLISKFENIFSKIKIFSYLQKLHKSLTKFPYLRTSYKVFPIILLVQMLTILNVFILFRAMNIQKPLIFFIAIIPIIQIISLIPITISGFGVRESAFVYFFGLLGIDPSISFTVSILNFLILTGVPAFMGGMISISRQIKKTNLLRKLPKFE